MQKIMQLINNVSLDMINDNEKMFVKIYKHFLQTEMKSTFPLYHPSLYLCNVYQDSNITQLLILSFLKCVRGVDSFGS